MADYWKDSVVTDRVWFPVTVSANTTKYFIVNNSAGTYVANPGAVFDFFDDFDGTSLDGTKWAAVSGTGGTATVENGYVHLWTSTYRGSTQLVGNTLQTVHDKEVISYIKHMNPTVDYRSANMGIVDTSPWGTFDAWTYRGTQSDHDYLSGNMLRNYEASTSTDVRTQNAGYVTDTGFNMVTIETFPSSGTTKGLWENTVLGDSLLTTAEHYPDATAYISFTQGDDYGGGTQADSGIQVAAVFIRDAISVAPTITVTNIDANTYRVQVDAGASALSGYALYADSIALAGDLNVYEESVLVSVSSITEIGKVSSSVTGNIVSLDGGGNATERGVVYDTVSRSDPGNVSPAASAYTSASTESGSFSTGSYTRQLSSLTAGTTYYVRTYYNNTNGYTYSLESSFTTLASTADDLLSILSPTSITASSATFGGGIVSLDAGGNATRRGFAYDTISRTNPGTVSPATSAYTSSVEEGNGTGNYTTGNFYLGETGLTAGTTYYVRAYYENSNGYAYGPEISFTTANLNPPTVDTTAVTSISLDSATANANITSGGDATIDERGFLYDTTSHPNPSGSYDSFELDMGDWVASGTLTWARSSGGTPSNGTGPSTGYHGNWYVYMETSAGGTGSTGFLEQDFGSPRSGSVDFYYHMYGTSMGTLRLEGWNGSTWTTIWSETGNQGDIWLHAEEPATSFTGYSKIRFVGVRGTSWSSDMAIDAVTVTLDSVSPAGTAYSNTIINSAGPFTTGTYTGSMTSLSSGTTYYVRSYAHNTYGYAYGDEVSFTTSSPVIPTTTVSAATSILGTSATLNGEITATGGADVTERGFVYDTTSKSYPSSSQTLLNSESFEVGAPGDPGVNWSSSGTSGWIRNSGGTTSANTGPSAAHDGTWYVYVETSSGSSYTSGNTDYLTYNIGTLSDGYVDFYYNQYGTSQGTLSLEGWDGASWNTIWSSTGNQGTAWINVGQASTSFTGYSQIRFKNVAAGNYLGDVALDLIKVYTGAATVAPASSGYASVVNESGSVYSTGTFSLSATPLVASTTYYVRAYSKNSVGYDYSDTEISFTTTAGGGVSVGIKISGTFADKPMKIKKAGVFEDATSLTPQ